MPIVNVVISEQAAAFLRKKAPKRTGAGLYITELLAREDEREKFQTVLERHKDALQDMWSQEAGLAAVE